MEIQFQKTVVSYLQTLVQQMQTQEETQQVRLSDAMPDIGRVIGSWGQVLLRGKQWRSDSVSISGGVKVWVLYEPEDGSQPQCVESWVPFQMNWSIPDADRDGVVLACPMPPVVDARMLSDRKLMVRTNIRMQACAMVSNQMDLYTPEEMPSDVQTLQNNYPMLLPVEAGEKAFELEETISLPMSEQPLENVLRYTLEPVLAEYKLVADKLVLRGAVRLQMLYMGTDERLHSWNTELPFSQYTQLEDSYESGAQVMICFGTTDLEMEKGEDGALILKAGIVAQYIIYDQKQIPVVEDMYSPNRTVRLTVGQLRLPAVLDMQDAVFHPEASSKNTPIGIMDAVFLPDVPNMQMADDQRNTGLGGTFLLLETDDEGKLQTEAAHWEDHWTIAASADTDTKIMVLNIEPIQSMGDTVRTELRIKALTTMQQPINVVTGAEIGEATEPDPNRPSLILCRIGEESLWELAKRTGSTVEKIRKLNGLDKEPPLGQMLLIPVI